MEKHISVGYCCPRGRVWVQSFLFSSLSRTLAIGSIYQSVYESICMIDLVVSIVHFRLRFLASPGYFLYGIFLSICFYI